MAFAIARTNAPAMEKLERLLTAVHHHAKMMLIEARPMHEVIVAATQQNWPIIRTHIERMVTIFEAITHQTLLARSRVMSRGEGDVRRHYALGQGACRRGVVIMGMTLIARRVRTAVCTDNLNAGVAVMKSAQDGE
jgi:hypothetical protein